MKTLNRLATCFSSLIGALEFEVQSQGDDDDQRACDHAGDDSRVIVGFVLLTEDSTSNDSTNATSSHQGSRAECTLPLTTDVVCLPGENAWDVGVAS